MGIRLASTAINCAHVARAALLGAEWVHHSGDPDDDVRRDPDGDEFCIVASNDPP